jgi:hypothetical protein
MAGVHLPGLSAAGSMDSSLALANSRAYLSVRKSRKDVWTFRVGATVLDLILWVSISA